MSTAVRALFSGDKKKKPPLPPKPRAKSPDEQSRPPKVPHKPAFLAKLLRTASKGSSKGSAERQPRLRRSDGEDDENTEESADFKDIDFGTEIFDFSSPVDNQIPATRTISTVAAKPEGHDDTLPAIDFSLDTISLDEPTIRILLSNPEFMATIAAMDEEAAVTSRLNGNPARPERQAEAEVKLEDEEEELELVTPVVSPEPPETEHEHERDEEKDLVFRTSDGDVEADWEDAVDVEQQVETPVADAVNVADSYYEPVAKPGEALMVKLAAEMADYRPPKKAQVGDPFAWRQMSLERYKGFGECHVGHDPPPTAYERIERDYNAMEMKLSRTTSPLPTMEPPRSPSKPAVPPRPRARSDNKPVPPPPPPRKPKTTCGNEINAAMPASTQETNVNVSDEIYENGDLRTPEVFEGERQAVTVESESRSRIETEEDDAPSDEAAWFDREAQMAETVVIGNQEEVLVADVGRGEGTARENGEEQPPEPKPRSRTRKRFLSADPPRTLPRRERRKEDGAVTKRVDDVRVWIPRRSRSFHSADEIRKKIDVQAQLHLRMPRKGRESTGNLSPERKYYSPSPVYSVVKKDYSRIWKPCKRDTDTEYKSAIELPSRDTLARTPPPPTPPPPYVPNAEEKEDDPEIVAEDERDIAAQDVDDVLEGRVEQEEVIVAVNAEETECEKAEETEIAADDGGDRVDIAHTEATATKVEPEILVESLPERRSSRPLPPPPPPPRPRHRAKKSDSVTFGSRDAETQMEMTDSVFSPVPIEGSTNMMGHFVLPELHVIKLRVSELEASKITACEIDAGRIRARDADGVRGGRFDGDGGGGGGGGGAPNGPPRCWSDKESQTENRRPKTSDRGTGGDAERTLTGDQAVNRSQPPQWDLSSQTTDSLAYETCAETIHGSDAGQEAEDDDRDIAAKRNFLLGWMQNANPYAAVVDSDGSLVASDTTEVRQATPPPSHDPVKLHGFKIPAGGVAVLPKLPRRSSDASGGGGGLRRSNAQRRKTTVNLMPPTSSSAPTTPQLRHTLGRGGFRFDNGTRSDSSASSVEGGTGNAVLRNPCRTWVDVGEAPGNLADNDNDASDGHVSRVLRNAGGAGGDDSDAEGTATIKKRLSSLFGGAKETRRKDSRSVRSKFYVEEPKLESPTDLLKKIAMTTEAVASYVADVVEDDVNNNNGGGQQQGETLDLLELPPDGVHKRASSEESAVLSDASLSEEHRLPKGNSFEMSDDAVEEKPAESSNNGNLGPSTGSLTVSVNHVNSNRIGSFHEGSEYSSEEDDEDEDSSETETTESGSSRSASVCSDERASGNLKKDKAFLVARELMTSECVFVDVLRLLNEDFCGAVKKANAEQGQPVIPDEVLCQIMGSLPQLQSLNEDLLSDFVKRIDKWDEIGKIADVIARKGPFLKLYNSYFRNYTNMIAMLDESCKRYPNFERVVKEFEVSERCQKLALKHYLVKPIQRIPQYRLLLQEYLKKLNESSADYENAQNALRIVSEVADHANETLKIGDNYAKMIEIQNKAPTFEIVKPGRVFVKEGELLKLSRKGLQPRFFVLFNDCLLHTTLITPSLMRIHHEFPITGMKVTIPNSEDYENEFSIISISRSFTISARSQKEKEEWVAALNGVIDENAKRRGTFVNARLQSLKSNEQSMKRNVLGRQAPVWVADARVTMCQLCASYFTLTFRRHHCRACGKVVCSLCSANRVPLKYLGNRTNRVCDDCFVVLQTEVTDDSDRLSVMENATTVMPKMPAATTLMRTRQPSKKRKALRRTVPNTLQEVHANDEGSSASGYLYKFVKKSWKKMWFVIKDKVLYSYMASEDVVALESIPLLGFDVVNVDKAFEGIHQDVIVRLDHKPQLIHIFYAGSVSAAVRWRKAMEEATKL